MDNSMIQGILGGIGSMVGSMAGLPGAGLIGAGINAIPQAYEWITGNKMGSGSTSPLPEAPSADPGDPSWSQISNDASSYLEGLFASTGENLLQTMQYNSIEAEKNRAWQERMASTSYQRTVQDLKKAGLNPLLAYGTVAQSVTPTSTAASTNAVTGDTLGSLLQVIASLASAVADFLPSKSISTILKGVAK